MRENDKTPMLVTALFTLMMIGMYAYRHQIEVIKDNQRDIDQRISNLEQSLHETDTAVVNIYQHLNEISYQNK